MQKSLNYFIRIILILYCTMTLGFAVDIKSGISSNSKEVAVVFTNNKLFYVSQKVFSLTPSDRARLISEKLVRLVKDPLIDFNDIRSVDNEKSSDIVLGDIIIMSVTDQDAVSANLARPILAEKYTDIIKKALNNYKTDYSFKSILLGLLYSILLTLFLIYINKILNNLFPRLLTKIQDFSKIYIKSLHIQKTEIISGERIAFVLIEMAKIAKSVIFFLLIYLYISLVSSFLPWTRGFSPVLFRYIFDPFKQIIHNFLAYIPNLFFIAVIIFITRYLLKLVRLIFSEIKLKRIVFAGFNHEWADPTYKIVRFFIFFFAIIAIFPYLPGSDSSAFKGISVFLGVLFSFGSSASIGNMLAGIVITYMSPFRLGDRVKIGEEVGDVIEQSLLVTRLRTIKNVDVTIPNSLVLSNHIMNYTSAAKDKGLILNTTVTIGYDVPWQKVHELLITAAQGVKDIINDPAPFVLQTSLDNDYVSYELNAYTKEVHKMAVIYSQLHQEIQNKFNAAKVEIMSPRYAVIRDGNNFIAPKAMPIPPKQ